MTASGASSRQRVARAATSAVAEPPCSPLERAIVQAVAYSDIFDYPLTAAEIHRYLMDIAVSRTEIDATLSAERLTPRYLSERDGYFTLPGREALVATRQRRAEDAARLWRRALRYGRVIASLPFVRMVAITGELAMDNVQPHSDIDYFIVTAPRRLWLCRLLIVAVVRAAGSRAAICPNYLLSERALALDDRNLYTAHEVAQMTPVAGFATYRRLRDLNGWVADFLPNAAGPPRRLAAPPRGRPLRMLAEWALRSRAGGRLERWEMDRKVRKLSRGGVIAEAAFSEDWCKGHVNGHEARILATFAERWRALEGLMQ